MFKDLKNHINNRITLVKYEIVDSTSHMISSAVYILIMAVLGFFLLLIGSIAAGFLLGKVFDDNGLGFLAITGLYCLFLLIGILFRKKIKLSITNTAVFNSMNALTNQNKDEEED